MEATKKNLEYYKRLPYSLRLELCDDPGVAKYYLAGFEELRGCKTEGSTETDAINNLYELFDEYIQTRIDNNLLISEPVKVKMATAPIKAKIVVKKIPIVKSEVPIDESETTLTQAKQILLDTPIMEAT